MNGPKSQPSHQNRPMYRGKTFKDGHIPLSINRKKKRANKPQENKYAEADERKTTSTRPLRGAVQPDDDAEIVVVIEEEEVKKISRKDRAIMKEIKHVRKRIRNIQESIQLSVNIAQPVVWEDNCLNAILNCVNEWKSIVAFHGSNSDDIISDDIIGCGETISEVDDHVVQDEAVGSASEEEQVDGTMAERDTHVQDRVVDNTITITLGEEQVDDSIGVGEDQVRVRVRVRVRVPVVVDSTLEEEEQIDNYESPEDYPMHPDNDWSKATALQVYGLIQMAMQTGPLKASNPGYFKRCGADVAKMALVFLIGCVAENAGGFDQNEDEDEDDGDGDGDVDETQDNGEFGGDGDGDGDDGDDDAEKTEHAGNVLIELRFTLKQKEAIEKWMKDAEKAIAGNKAPSKSSIKLQTSVNMKGMSRKDKRNIGNQRKQK